MKKTAQQIVTADNQQPTTNNRQPTTGNRQPATGQTWAGQALLAGAAVWFANWVLSEGGAVWGSPTLKVVLDGLSCLALVPLIYLIYRATAWVMERLLWRLRRRLIVTYLLIGLLPAILLIVLVALIGYVVILESQARLVQKQLANRLTEAQSITQALAAELNQTAAHDLPNRLTELTKTWQPLFPALQLSVVQASDAAPRWTMEEDEHHGWVMSAQGEASREVYGFHAKRLSGAQPVWLQFRYSVAGLSEQLSRATGLQVSAGHARLELARNPHGEAQLTANPTTRPIEGLPIFVPMREWESGRVIEGEALHLAPDFLLPTNLWQGFNRFRRESLIGNVLVWTIGGIAVIFAIIAALAVTAAMMLTRSVTHAVHHLYEGTQRVEAGDLQHEIRVTGRDQLGELGHSFNRMMRSLRELLRVSAEKQRLDQEMAIAAQVQARLFPRALPRCDTLDLAVGVCQPARIVSGDYFDYFEIASRPEGGLIGFVVADVCGKGVSAALLMANLQAHLRSRALSVMSEPRNLCELVSHVNQRMAEASPDASYVTMFYAEYDEAARVLRYVNAGHNPPLLLQGAAVARLSTGGTVVGLFRDSVYEEAAVQLSSGDLFVAYTDGLLEARNPAGEELGEERLLDWLNELRADNAETIKQNILQRALEWTAHAEQEDDLTLLVWRKR